MKHLRGSKPFFMGSIIVFGCFVFSILFLHFICCRSGNPDAIRVSAVKQLQVALKAYAKKNEFLYPRIPSSCSNIEVLQDYIGGSHIATIPRERNYGHPEYQVAVSPDMKTYILKAPLYDEEYHALSVDIDGDVMGCHCDDPNFCLSNREY